MNNTKERRREIKKVLLNHLMLTEDHRLTVCDERRITLWGVGDGAGAAFLLGVKNKTFEMETTFSNHRQAIYRAQELMKDMGRSLFLHTAEEGACVLVRHVFFRPVVLILEEEEEEKKLVLNAYCGRAILTLPSVYYVVSQFEKLSDGKISRVKREK